MMTMTSNDTPEGATSHDGGPFENKAELGVPSLLTAAAVVVGVLVLKTWKLARGWYDEL